MAIEGILFDKDGTLVEFLATWIPAYRIAAGLAAEFAGDPDRAGQLLRSAGYDPVRGVLDPDSLLAGGTTGEICEVWAAAAGAAPGDGLAGRLHAAMDRHVARHAVPVGAGLAELFARLAGRGLALGIATTDGEAAARATARTLGLADSVGFLCGYDSGFGAKPGPGMVQGFCAAVGIAPAGVLVVGDTRHDMAMARAAGAGMAVGVLTGAATRGHLAPCADRIIASVLEIESVLAGPQ